MATSKLKLETLCEALRILRYSRLDREGKEWRRGKFHLHIRRKGKRRLILSLHVDVPSPLPPFHRARHRGKDLQLEKEKILSAYASCRAKPARPP